MLANNCQSRGRKPSIPKVKKTGEHELGQAEPRQKGKTLDCLDLRSVLSLCTNQLTCQGSRKSLKLRSRSASVRGSLPLASWPDEWPNQDAELLQSPTSSPVCHWVIDDRDTRHKVYSESFAKTGCSTVLGGHYSISWWWQSSQSQQAWTLSVIMLLRQAAAAYDTMGSIECERAFNPPAKLRLVTRTASTVWLWAIHLSSCCSLWVLIWKWKHPLHLLQRPNPVEPGKCLTHSPAPRKCSICHH